MLARDSLIDIARSYDKILVFGAGGGGDALGAMIVWKRLQRLGANVLLGSVVWERFIIDPYPGPIPVETLAGAEPIGWTAALVDGETVALRYGSTLKPQIVRIAGFLGEKAVFLDLSKGGEGLKNGLNAVMEELGVDALVGVDTGGDILAHGCEENLWSPLADAISLYALSEAAGEDGYVVVLAPGADGELPQEKVLAYTSMIAAINGLLEVFGLSRDEYKLAHEAETHVYSEASKIPLRAFEGGFGEAKIRGGTRTVKLNPCTASAYLLEASKVRSWSPLPELVKGTLGIAQASEELNRHCIVTELDLEMELSRLRESGSRRPMSLDQIKSELRTRLFSKGCKPIECPKL
ncbi:MAG: DUF1152 domain-containing protein [Desulfurococcales archaeon]|nr:DUF1152 domain-containing protein [Desulfurococcales archaeon]